MLPIGYDFQERPQSVALSQQGRVVVHQRIVNVAQLAGLALADDVIWPEPAGFDFVFHILNLRFV
jgi:hypothetical protein